MRRFGGIIVGFAVLLAGTVSSAEVFYVDRDVQGINPTGRSWQSAFPSVQQAINAAAKDGGEVWVKAGTHKPKGWGRKSTFELKPGVALYGGFRGNETKRSQRNSRANRTVLSGDIGRIGSLADNCHHVVIAASGSRIDGFIVSGGNANAKTGAGGGALLIDRKAKGFTLSNCTLEKNHGNIGGGMYAAASGITLTNCTFYGNSAESGGALYIGNGASLRAVDCRFSSNFARDAGGAVSIGPTSKSHFTRTWFLFNRTDGNGGAMIGASDKVRGIELEMDRCDFVENNAALNGGALFMRGEIYPVASHCRFEKNTAVQGAGAIANENGATMALLEPVLAYNRSARGFSDIHNDASAGTVADLAGIAEETEPEPEPKVKRTIADAPLIDPVGGETSLKTLLEQSQYTVVAIGDLTDPAFIKSYREVEAAARDYSEKGVAFHYLYTYLLHPENNGYVQPATLEERLQHILEAKKLFRTRIDWLCDPMDNPAANILARDSGNLFIFSKEGREEYAGLMADRDTFRAVLTKLAGPVKKPTLARTFTPSEIQPVAVQAPLLVERVRINPETDPFTALRCTAVKSRNPCYVKVRAEASEELLETGNGQLYLGFRLDPLYPVRWNNAGKPPAYTVKMSRGSAASPSSNQAEKIDDVPTDSEPREFMVEIRKWKPGQPLAVTLTYSANSTRSRRAVDLTQRYVVYLEEDAFGGKVFGRQIPE